MGLFSKLKRKESTLKQDLRETQDNKQSVVFIMHLLMEEQCNLPSQEEIVATLKKHSLDVDTITNNEKMLGVAVQNYSIKFDDVESPVHPQLLITDCSQIEKPFMSDIDKTQLWNCPEGMDILESCKYQVFASDMMAAPLEYKDRADMLVNFVEALVELFPTCKAVVFENSKKMFTRDAILNCDVPKESRFIYYAVNARFFNIEGTDDMMVDTVGMSTLFMPDLQYHFHGVDPNAVVNHAYNMLSYMYDCANPIKDGDHIDGITDGQMSMDVQWNVQYERSLIQPVREVIDVNMGEFASGKR